MADNGAGRVEFVRQDWKSYGAYAYAVTIDGKVTNALLLKTQHPGNAFRDAWRFWTIAKVQPRWALHPVLDSLYPADWPNVREARAAIEAHVAEAQP